MHRIALLSDIHGNLPALVATLADIDRRDVSAAICLGDLVDFGPWSNEVIDLVRSRAMPTVMGNHDERIAMGYAVRPSAEHTDEENAARVLGVAETRRVITESNRQYLADLPREIRAVFGTGRERCEVLLVHASPRSLDEHLYEDCPVEELQEVFEEARADALVMGHTHYPYVRRFRGLGSGDERELLAVNCGSVGRLKERLPMASYALLTVEGGRVEAEIVRVPYPIEETIRGIRESEIPDFYAEFLEKRMAGAVSGR